MEDVCTILIVRIHSCWIYIHTHTHTHTHTLTADKLSNMSTTTHNKSSTSPSANSAPKTTPISTTTTTSSSSSTTSSAKRSNSEKGPRVRTVLSEQQLQTLRTVYASNPRPDALLKEQLVEITGLSPRVIRVWFQNKRCKDKKKAIQAEAARMHQQQAMQAGAGSVSCEGREEEREGWRENRGERERERPITDMYT